MLYFTKNMESQTIFTHSESIMSMRKRLVHNVKAKNSEQIFKHKTFPQAAWVIHSGYIEKLTVIK